MLRWINSKIRKARTRNECLDTLGVVSIKEKKKEKTGVDVKRHVFSRSEQAIVRRSDKPIEAQIIKYLYLRLDTAQVIIIFSQYFGRSS